jgi:hypothetical protein
MRDPHVVSLTYLAVPSESASFDRASPIGGTIEDIRYSLGEGRLVIEPAAHFSSAEEARAHVDPLLRAWEIDIGLQFGSPELSFAYETAEVIDRNPPPPGSGGAVLIATLGELTIAGAAATLTVSRGRYPSPPRTFRTSPDVETLWMRYQGYRNGREPLPSMAYLCLTTLEAIAGGRQLAATMFKISPQVLSKMGQVTSERGDPTSARKYSAVKSGSPLAGPEVHWLEEAVKAIIRRVGEAHDVNALPTITLNDLPAL